MAIGYSGEKFGYNIGFLICGLLTLLSLIPILKTKENEFQEKEKISNSKRILNILIAFVVVGLFWGFYELSSIRTFDLQLQLSEVSTLDIPNHLWQSLNSIFILPIGIIAIIFWTYFYSNQFFKLMLGFIFGVISFGILFLIPEVPTEQHTITYLISLLFLAISEIHIAPIIHSILTKYSNPKFLAILISLAFLPTRLISLAFGLFNDKLYDHPMLGLKIGIVGMTAIGIGLIGYILINKNIKDPKQRQEVINHEQIHINDIQSGLLYYDDENVYSRKSVNDKWQIHSRTNMKEGSKSLPWEQKAHKHS